MPALNRLLTIKKNKIRQKSLTLLNEKALNADFKVGLLLVQKLIRKKDVRPINSHPIIKRIILSDITSNIILNENHPRRRINLSTLGSFLK
mgnify:CR=1 FL=1